MSDELFPPEETPQDAAFRVGGVPKDDMAEDGLTLGELLSDEVENDEDTKEFATDPTESLPATERLDMGANFASRRRRAPAETSEERFGEAADESTPDLWQRLAAWIRPRRDAENRLTRLSQAITTYPDAPTNYTLRGELYLENHEYAQAIADFRRAVELASAQIDSDRWGLVAQAVRDRALDGLRKAQKKNSNRKER